MFVKFVLAFVALTTVLGHTRKTFHSSVISLMEIQFTLKCKTSITLVALEIPIEASLGQLTPQHSMLKLAN